MILKLIFQKTKSTAIPCFRFLILFFVVFQFTFTFGQTPPDSNQFNLPFPITNSNDPTQTTNQSFDLGDPSGVERTIVYDPILGKYIFKETIGNSGINYRNPSLMTLDEYIEYERQKAMQSNWKEKIDAQTASAQALEFPFKIPSKAFSDFFGSDEISIKPQGSIEISLGVNSSRYDNPVLPVRARKITRFDFNQQIQMNLVGNIGTKIKLNTSYNTLAAFDFDNITKLGYSGNEDQIMQRIELGQVSFPAVGSLIPGSQTLFGAYTKLRFGNLWVDAIAAQQKGKRQEINITGKAQVQNFEVQADNYEANRHYFLGQYFQAQYDASMTQLPNVSAETYITRIEVWVTNRINSTDNARNILAFSDLGETDPTKVDGNPGGYLPTPFPSNSGNGLYSYLSTNTNVRSFNGAVPELSSQTAAPGPFNQAVHFEKVETARKLSESEFNYNALLGFISLSQPLNNDEVLAVAYEYTYRGQTFQVGEFSTDGITGTDALILKMLKPTITNPILKSWDLMMKNVYSIGAYQVDKQGFRLNILYNNPETSQLAPVIPVPGLDENQIITMVEMDRYNVNNQPFSDGMFDFIPMTFQGAKGETGGTINPKNGRIYFTTIEPFGKTLKNKMTAAGVPPIISDRIAYTELYDSTKTAAQQIPSKNRFTFKGEYQSSVSSDIPLNALNVPEGAVTVTAGGIALTEGTDFTVDYNLGRVKILNNGILESGTPIKISIESNSVFGFQAKSMLGTHFQYRFNKDFNIGATWLRMMERPVTQKVDFGSEPFKNNVLGFDINYRGELPFLTKAIDFLPIISTKEKSFITFKGEYARLIPGTPRAITGSGISYIDDFEGAQSTIDLKSPAAWRLASTPQGQPDLFPEGNSKSLVNGFKRSKLAWYNVDPIFYQQTAQTPSNIVNNPAYAGNFQVNQIIQTDVFPNTQLPYGTIPQIQVFDLAFYPQERGMYNYDTTSSVNSDGTFTNPEDRWGGISRSITTNDFELANIQYIQFWVLDPFNVDAESVNPSSSMTGGDLYFNIGNISEDVLPDSRKSFENGLPPSPASTNFPVSITPWAQVSSQQVVVNAFDNDPANRVNQDVGLDGYANVEERNAYAAYVNWVQNNTTLDAATKARMIQDPSSDDYNFYFDDNFDALDFNVLERYKRYNGMEGNSPTTEMSDTANADGYPTLGRQQPDIEDINLDNNLTESEQYFQYKVSLRPQDLIVGQNFIISKQDFTPKGAIKSATWYQFRIPLVTPQKVVNGIRDFRTIRFMRMFMKGFEEQTVVRFADLELLRGEWRPYLLDLNQPGESVQTDPNDTDFNIGTLNFEENAARAPVPYVIPPGIQREIDPSQPQQRQINEQCLTMNVCELKDGDARAGYKNVQFDVRTYKKMKMFIHAEELQPGTLNDDDVTVFVRLGNDFVDNYYELELPLKLTPWGTSSDIGVWPETNNLELIFDELLALKTRRNKLSNNPTSGVTLNTEFSESQPNFPDRFIRVKGNPSFQGIRTMMIGVRNPSINDVNPWSDDGQAKCVEVWVNELRLTDFVDDGGDAATAQLQLQAADFANVSVSGNYSGINWGAVDSRVQERQRNQRFGFDFQTTMQLGQLLGNRFKINLPFFYGYSLGVINPEYDPFNPDIRISSYEGEQRKQVAEYAQDFTERKSYNFSGIRKERAAGRKAHFFDLANWTLSYSYNENVHRDFNTEFDRTKIWRNNLAYAYSFSNKPFEPFKKVKALQKNPWFALIRDFNIGYAPKNISFTNDIVRNYNERLVRNTIDTASSFVFPTVYVKQFTWNRNYKLGWDLTKNLKLSYGATNRSIFDEGNGRVDRKLDPIGYQAFRDTVRNQLGSFGKTMDFTHDYNFQYTIPLDKIPALNWITANAKYSGTYNWQRAALGQTNYGNIVQNSRVINAQAQANFTNLYNKSAFLKRVNGTGGGRGATVAKKDTKSISDGKDGEDKKVEDKKPSKIPELKPPKPLDEMTKKELKAWKKQKRKHDKEQKIKLNKDKKVNPVLGFFARILMSVRNVQGTYNQTDGTLLPGSNQENGIIGLNPSFDDAMLPFVFGKQSYGITGNQNGYDYGRILADNNWMVTNPSINRQRQLTNTSTFTGRANLEPFKDFSIDLTMNRNFGRNDNDFFRFNPASNQFESQSRLQTTTLTYSTISIGSAFEKLPKDFTSANFNQMRANTENVSQFLGGQNANSINVNNGYNDGYGISQQEVLIGAFLSSFTNGKVNSRSVNPFRSMPLPNWTVTYNGLTKFEAMRKIVKNFVVRHGYSSSVALGGVQSNLLYQTDGNGDGTIRDLNNNFLGEQNIQTVSITERFSPLIGVDATWNIGKKQKDSKGKASTSQGLLTKFEYKKDRAATLSLANNQVTEILGTEIVIGTGYKFDKVKFPWKIQDKAIYSPLNIRFDFTFRDNLTVIRKVVEQTNQATAGQRVVSIKSSIDYNLNANLTLQYYYDQVITTPKIQTSFPTGNLSTGIRLRFNLGGLSSN
jgi:cell surface protein SprA